MKKLLTIKNVLEKLQIKRTAFYYLRKTGAFPEPIYLTGSKKSIRWLEEDVDFYIDKKENFLFYLINYIGNRKLLDKLFQKKEFLTRQEVYSYLLSIQFHWLDKENKAFFQIHTICL